MATCIKAQVGYELVTLWPKCSVTLVQCSLEAV